VLTGGEPLLQVDSELIDALHAEGFRIAVETNGTIAPPEGIDWVCVSPKAGSQQVAINGHELKLVWPQDGFDALDLARFESQAFTEWFIQPKDVSDPAKKRAYTKWAIELCMARPQWRLSVQTHKVLLIR
jgi:7-carboxy-7-deazaguanine synthase